MQRVSSDFGALDDAYSFPQFEKEWGSLDRSIKTLSACIPSSPNKVQFEERIDELNFSQMALVQRVSLLQSKDKVRAAHLLKQTDNALTELEERMDDPKVEISPAQRRVQAIERLAFDGIVLAGMGLVVGKVLGSAFPKSDDVSRPATFATPIPKSIPDVSAPPELLPPILINPDECTNQTFVLDDLGLGKRIGVDGAPDVRLARRLGDHPTSNVPLVLGQAEINGVPSELTDAEADLWTRLEPQIPKGTTVTPCGYGDPEGMAGQNDNSDRYDNDKDRGYDRDTTHWKNFLEHSLKAFRHECKALDGLCTAQLGSLLEGTVDALVERGYSLAEATMAVIDQVKGLKDDPIVRGVISIVRSLPTYNGTGGVYVLPDPAPGISVRDSLDAMIDLRIQSVESDLQEILQGTSENNGITDFLSK